jgi:hypothetical protein
MVEQVHTTIHGHEDYSHLQMIRAIVLSCLHFLNSHNAALCPETIAMLVAD